MKTLHVCLAAVLAVVLGVYSTATAAPESISIPDAIKKQTPADAFVLVYLPSLKSTMDAVGQTAAAVDPQMQMMVQMVPAMALPQMMKRAKGGPVAIDMDAPFAIAVSPSADGPMGDPSVSMMVTIKGSTDGVSANGPRFRLEKAGGQMLVLTTRSDKTPLGGPAELFENIPAGDVSIAFDQAKAVEIYGPMLNMMAPMMMGAQPGKPADKQQQQQVQQAMAQAKTFMDMFASWDFGMTFKGSEMDVNARWVLTNPADKSYGASDFDAYTEVMTAADASVGMIMSRGLLDCLISADAQMSMGMDNDKLKSLFALATHAVQGMTGSTGASYGISDKGMWGMQILDVKDAETYLTEVTEMVKALDDADMGISVEDLPLVDASGRGYLMKVDMAKLMDSMGMKAMVDADDLERSQGIVDAILGGKAGVPIRYLHKGNKFAIVFGHKGSVIGRAKQILAGRDVGTPNTLTNLVSSAQGSPMMVAAVDVRKMVGQLMKLFSQVPVMVEDMGGQIPTVPAGDPIMVTGTATTMLKGGQLIATIDVGGLAAMGNAMQKQIEDAQDQRQKAAMKN